MPAVWCVLLFSCPLLSAKPLAAQFSAPNAQVGNGTYGQVTSQANNPRLVQLSARVSF
jgi:hypothetical protein